jgi:hypothetical protein
LLVSFCSLNAPGETFRSETLSDLLPLFGHGLHVIITGLFAGIIEVETIEETVTLSKVW